MTNRMYVLKIDSNFDETLKKFQDQLDLDEEIFETSISESRLVVVTRKRSSGVLLDTPRRK